MPLATAVLLVLAGHLAATPRPAAMPTGSPILPSSGAGPSLGRATGAASALVAIQFKETGLREGVNWSVTLKGSTLTGWGPEIVFFEEAGVYPFNVSAVGYNASPSNGSVTVAQQYLINVNIAFQILWAGPYSVTFVENGLGNGSSWSVDLAGTLQSASGTSIQFGGIEPGTYSYRIANAGTWTAAPAAGSVTVNSVNVTVPVGFVAPPSPTPRLGPILLTPGGIFATACFGLWTVYVAYFITHDLLVYRQAQREATGGSRRRGLNKARFGAHVAGTVVWGVALVTVALSPGLSELGSWVYGFTLLVLMLLFIARRSEWLLPSRLGGSYLEEPAGQGTPCWRCGLLNPENASFCGSCGAALQS